MNTLSPDQGISRRSRPRFQGWRPVSRRPPRSALPQITTELEPGDVLLLHTDGLTERNPHLRDETELRTLLATVDGHDAHEILQEIERQALGPGPLRLADDVAILLLRPQSR